MTKLAILAIAGLLLLAVGGFGVNAYYTVPTEQEARFILLEEALLPELKTEVLTDPQNLGYSGKTNNQIAILLNTVGLSGEVVDREFVAADVMQSQVVASEYLLLLSAERDLWAAMLQGGGTSQGVPVSNDNIRTQATTIWGPLTTTRANLIALLTKPASRAEVLFGDGVTVSDHDIEEALLLP